MNSKYISMLVALFVSSLALSQSVFADEKTCADINWKPNILASFAGIDQACQEVVIRDGKNYAHFEVKLVRAQKSGQVTVQMKLRDGSYVKGTFFAPMDFHVLSDSGRTRFHMDELSPGDVLDVFIPESRIENGTLGENTA
ncbi:MAG: hypothetical protein CL797_08665 [Chromatiales bacterium]|jgi:hypothetical protein|nr:hypothetical protein [Chromatiales bacterium]